MTELDIAEQVAKRLIGVVTTFQAFDMDLTLDPENRTVYDPDGTPIWEFEEEQDYKGKSAEELKHEIESIFWYDRDIYDSVNNDEQ